MDEILLGDAYELIKGIPDKSIDCIITDPPYELSGYDAKIKHGLFKNRKKSYTLEISRKGLDKGIRLNILDEFVRVMKKINIYLWCNKEQIYDYLTYFSKERKCNWEMIVWAKGNPPPFTCGHYLKDKEYCLYFWEKGVKVNPTTETGKTVYITELNVKDKKLYNHPTIKPRDIIDNLVLNSTERGGNT